MSYAVKLTVRNESGRIASIGFIPNYGNSWLYLYGWLNGGEFMSQDGKKVTLTNPRIVEALEYMVKVYDALGGRKEIVSAYEKSFTAVGTVGDPFINGQLAMKIDGNWYLNSIARYRPEMDFGVAPPPPAKGNPSVTWSGGFSLVIPKGAKHPKEAWEFINWMISKESALIEGKGQKEYNESVGRHYYVPRIFARRSTNLLMLKHFPLADEKLQTAQKMFVRLLETSRSAQ
jgi:multiple sugar transport system permease protein